MKTRYGWLKALAAIAAALLVLACAVGMAACEEESDGSLEARMDEIEAKLSETEEKLDETQGKLEETEFKLSETEKKVGELEEELEKTQSELDAANKKIDEMESLSGSSGGSSSQSASGDLSYAIYYDGTGYMVTGIGDWTDPDLVIPEEHNGLPVVGIDKWAFCAGESNSDPAYTFLKSVTIPDSVEYIERAAFSKCSGIESVTIGTGVKSAGHEAFYGLDSLREVHISDIGAWCEINWVQNILYQSQTVNLYLNGELVEDVAVPDTVTYIGDEAFSYCTTLTSIVIPKSVESIGSGAFSDCSSLSAIYYCGTAEEWNAVTGVSNAKGTIYYYSESEPAASGNFWHYDEYGEIVVWGDED